MGKAAKLLQFWRSFLVASVPLVALPLLFVHSEGKVNMALSSAQSHLLTLTTTMNRETRDAVNATCLQTQQNLH